MFGYAFIYTDSRLKKTVMNPPSKYAHLQYEAKYARITIKRNNNPKTKKKLKKNNKNPKITILNMLESNLSP
jgi:hypothetical protein